MTRDEFARVLDRLAAGWRDGDAAAVAAAFAEDVRYLDPVRYRFTARDALLPFFEPPPGGHHVTWHSVLFDETAQTGVAEYTYVGEHRYHGAVVVEVTADGLIKGWREWQHVDDTRDWPTFMAGPEDGVTG